MTLTAQQPPPELAQTFAPDAAPPPSAQDGVARLVRYWQSLRPGPGLLPGRQHIDPAELAELEPHLWLLDVVQDDSRRYRVNFIGTGLIKAGTPFHAGAFLSDCVGPLQAAEAHRFLDRIVATGEIDWRRGPSVLSHPDHIQYLERIFLPLAADGCGIDMLLCMTLFYWRDGQPH